MLINTLRTLFDNIWNVRQVAISSLVDSSRHDQESLHINTKSYFSRFRDFWIFRSKCCKTYAYHSTSHTPRHNLKFLKTAISSFDGYHYIIFHHHCWSSPNIILIIIIVITIAIIIIHHHASSYIIVHYHHHQNPHHHLLHHLHTFQIEPSWRSK